MHHLMAYVLTLALLYAIMYFENNGEFLPVLIVGLSWGIGLSAHYHHTFGTENLDLSGIHSDWEEELEKELDRLVRRPELREQIDREYRLLEELDRLQLRETVRRPLKNGDLLQTTDA